MPSLVPPTLGNDAILRKNKQKDYKTYTFPDKSCLFLLQNTMLRYQIPALQLKTIADVLKDLLAECWFVFEPSKIHMTNVDPEKVISVSLQLQPTSDVYQCTTKFVFPFYIQTLYRVLRGVKHEDVAILKDGPGNSLCIEIVSNNVLRSSISLQPLNEVFPTFLQQKHHYDVEYKMSSKDLYRILHDLSALSRKVNIHVNNKEVKFISEDETGSQAVYTQSFENTSTYQFQGSYLIKYLEKFSKPGLSKELFLMLHHRSPLTLIYRLEHGSLEMSIAPSK